MTDEEKKTRRARRSQQREAEGGAETGKDSASSELVKDRNLRLRDEAARKRAGRKREREVAAAMGLDTKERVDDALQRWVQATTKFMDQNFRWLQWVLLASIAGVVAYFIVDYRQTRHNEKAADALMLGVADTQGRVAGQGEWRTADPNLVDPRPEFASNDERLKAAEKKFRDALGENATPNTRLLAQVGLGGVLYDQGKFAAARTEFEAVRADKGASRAPEALARAVEGIGFCHEAEGNLPEALKAFEALGGQAGYGELARYHRARVLHAQGERDKALELLKKLREELAKDAEPGKPPSYLRAAVDELTRAIDPRALPKETGGQTITPEQLEQLKKQFEEMQRKAGQAPEGGPSEGAPDDNLMPPPAGP